MPYEYRGVRYYHCEVTGRYFCNALDDVEYSEDEMHHAIDRHLDED